LSFCLGPLAQMATSRPPGFNIFTACIMCLISSAFAKRRIHNNAVECSWIAVALQEIGLPSVIDTINRAEPVTRERQREGIAIARREGKYRGRKPSLTPARAAELRRRVADGDSKAELAREFGISRDTLYRYVPVKKRRAGKRAK
jgi:hypothetical protein